MKKKESKAAALLTLVLFAVFALCILGVLLTGAKSYESLNRRGSESYTYRTAAQYLATRVRQRDEENGLSVEEFEGLSTLVLRQEIEGEGYLTRIYCYGGFLRELFSTEAGAFSPEDGEKLMELDALSFEKRENLLLAQVGYEDGQKQLLYWHLHAGEVQP